MTSSIRTLVQCIMTNKFKKELLSFLLRLGEKNQMPPGKQIMGAFNRIVSLKNDGNVGALWVCARNIFHSLNLSLFWRACASLYPLTSFLNAWLLDVYLTRAVSCASLRSHIRETRVIKEGTLPRDCNRRNCARSLNMTGAPSQSERVRSRINNEQMLKYHRYMHAQRPLTSLCLGRLLGTFVFRITIYVTVFILFFFS